MASLQLHPYEVPLLLKGLATILLRPVDPPPELAMGFDRERLRPGAEVWCSEPWRSWDETCSTRDESLDDDHRCDLHCWQTYVAYAATPRVGFRPRPDRARITFLHETTPLERNPKLLGPWSPASAMERWASRLSLQIIGIERVRAADLPEATILFEGLTVGTVAAMLGLQPWPMRAGHPTLWNARGQLYDSIYGAGAWDRNPSLWSLHVEVLEPGEAAVAFA